MAPVQLTVLFATRNGELVLPRTLEAYRQSAPPAVPWKLIVVDNGSSDSTPSILRSFKSHLPMEIFEQPKAGKNRALNTGLDAIEGRLVVVTDDDAVPAASFLTAWTPYLDQCGDFGLFGGTIEPSFVSPPPHWVVRNALHFVSMFAERNLPEGAVAPEEIYGCNMAVRAEIFEQGFRFAENIGPNHEDPHYPMGSEVEFCRRVARSGVASWFARAPRVQHLVRPHQYHEYAWADRAYRCGRGRAQIMWQEGSYLDPPPVSLIDRLAMMSPLQQHRARGLFAYHLARGFNDECTRRKAMAVE